MKNETNHEVKAKQPNIDKNTKAGLSKTLVYNINPMVYMMIVAHCLYLYIYIIAFQI